MTSRRTPKAVREPVQVYMTGEERGLLDRLSLETGLSRAEVLRQGLRAYARTRSGQGAPLLAFLREMAGDDWPADVARAHDAHFDEAALDSHESAAAQRTHLAVPRTASSAPRATPPAPSKRRK